jgi:putative tricarboxylic transport membrane protein
MVGVFSINNNIFDMWVVLVFGLLGYVMRKTGFEPGPLILAFVLGPIMERSFRQSLLISNGDPTIFFTRPISGALMGIAALLIALSAFQFLRKRSRERAGDAEG